MSAARTLVRALPWPLIRAAANHGGRDLVSGAPVHKVPSRRLGSGYGGWIIPEGRLGAASICYCAGVGEDITFDLALIEAFGCHAWGIDPTPRARAHVEKVAAANPSYHFEPVGLWSKDEVKRFYVPAKAAHVSHSIVNLQGTSDYFEADCKRLSSLMARLGHTRLDLLKLDVEGAEYEVLQTIVEDKVEIDILCVEYDEAYHPLDGGFRRRIAASIAALRGVGYEVIAHDKRCNYTLVRRALL